MLLAQRLASVKAELDQIEKEVNETVQLKDMVEKLSIANKALEAQVLSLEKQLKAARFNGPEPNTGERRKNNHKSVPPRAK